MDENAGIAPSRHDYTFEDFNAGNLSTSLILMHCPEHVGTHQSGFFDLHPQYIEINTASFRPTAEFTGTPEVKVCLKEKDLTLSCDCNTPKRKLCVHQAQVLFNIMQRPEIRLFFDSSLRHQKIRQEAIAYGLENEPDPDTYFLLVYDHKSVEIKPRKKALFPVSKLTPEYLEAHVVPKRDIPLPCSIIENDNAGMILVIGQHKYYKQLTIALFEAQFTQNGKIKNPLKPLKPLDLMWKTEQKDVLKFFMAIAGFQNNYDTAVSETDIEALKALVKNPLGLKVFYHNAASSENITANAVVPVELGTFPIDLRLTVNVRANFYEVKGHVVTEDRLIPLDKIHHRFTYFILIDKVLQLIDNYDFLRVIDFFKQYSNKLLIHASKFEKFRENLLSRLEHKVHISYTYLKPATPEQLRQSNLDQNPEKVLYLSASEDYILITPVMKYGTMEIPVLSKKQRYALDLKGVPYTLPRDEAAELQFTASLLKAHPDFRQQLDQPVNRDHFYLHVTQFLDEDWFLETFEEWQKQTITVLGFKEISANKYNPNKAKISVGVSSGINWFDTAIAVQFGNEKVRLKHLQKAAKNKTRFVPLGDGSLGILPAAWIEKFRKYFQVGEIAGEILRTPKINFSGIAEMYEEEMLDETVKKELASYHAKITRFEAIEQVQVPPDLNGTLRPYQQQGLNWLHFLDDLNFGGCLADDMGLGKTIQVIAFILSQRSKGHQNTNLIVVPTSLIFNWEAEVTKYAPSIQLLTLHGAGRITDISTFKAYEIVLTTYGTLLSDIRVLKKFSFNYIILDESQAIKNPHSQRYKAARLLRSRNKLLLTGTPIENNTYDLYGQFSFACPGLLGSKQYFKQHYATPIDRFKDHKRLLELRQKINPFILRRTKEQVAKELPDKTEMVIFCEMGQEQRKVYDAYARQFRDFLNRKKDDEVSTHSMHVLQGLTKLRQICNSPALLADEESYGNASAKIEVLMEQIEGKSPNHKILVFSQFVTMLELVKQALEDRNIAYQYLTGQTKDRAAEVDNFQNNEAVRVFLISLKAGGTGLNLTEADYVYMVDPWWNPAVENQAIDRSHRIGQKKNVVAVRLICPDTIEEKMMALQESKIALATDLVRTDHNILKSLSKEELLALFE